MSLIYVYIIFSVFIGQKCCMYRRFMQEMRDTRMNPDVELKVFKILYYEILIMLEIKFITKQNYIQGSDTNLEFNTWPVPNLVGLLTFHTVGFLLFDLYNNTVLMQAGPKISLIKMSHLQMNIIIFFITFWELNEVQSPYVVGLNKRNDFCEN